MESTWLENSRESSSVPARCLASSSVTRVSCNAAFMDATLTYLAVWRSAPAYPHTEHPNGDIGNKRSVSFLGPQVLYEQTQSPPGERLLNTENVCYTFADPEGMIDKVELA